MYNIITTRQFDKDISLIVKRKYNIETIKQVISDLEKNGKLTQKYKPHKLKGNYYGYWECHIKPDWLLLWLQDDEKLKITLVRTGTHSDLF
jgi:mRNA interferase YafQ